MAFSEEVGIDLGTANVLVYIKGKGIVLSEPSVVAINRDTDEILAVGEEARQMLGRTPANIVAVRPLKDGVISDYDVTERMLKYFIRKSCGSGRFFRPRIMVCVPSGVTEVEKRAVREAATQAGGKMVYLMEEPVAAAIGAGIDISKPDGQMVIDIGGGTTDIAVIALGGIVTSESIKVAGAVEGGSLVFSVTDDGCGFDMSNVQGIGQGHYGLQGIRERLARLHGNMSIDSETGKGTRVRVSMPIPEEKRKEFDDVCN